MSSTFNDLNEVKSFDVIFVGHLASVAANIFAIQTKNLYKSLALSKHSTLINRNIEIAHRTILTSRMHRTDQGNKENQTTISI